MAFKCYGCGAPLKGKNSVAAHAQNNPTTCTTAMRFHGRVDHSSGPDACWPWKGALHRQGYGLVAVNRRMYSASRLAYQLIAGEIPKDMQVMHICDNPPCCNPKHLRLGTQDENAKDRKNKGRSRNQHTGKLQARTL